MHQHLTKWQRRRRRLRLSIQGAIAFVVIGGAVVLACVAVAMPWLVSHPEKVRAFLSEKLKRPVTFRALQGRWSPRGPIFTLDGVSLVDPTGGGSFDIDRAELVIDFYSWMRKDASFSEFRVVGVQADVVRDAAGKITIARLAGGAKSANANNTLFDLGGVSLGSAQVELRDEERGTSLSLSRVDLRMVNDGASRRFGGVAWIDAQSPPLRFACVADPRVAHCHVLARELEPALWLAQMPLAGIQPMSGKASAEIWFDYVDGRLESLRVETEAEQLVLRGTEPVPLGDGLAIEPRTQLTDWRAAARWRRDAQGWRLDVLEWRGDDDVPDTQLKLVARDTPNGRGYGVEASRLELSRLAPLAALSSAVPPKLRAVLFEGAPRGRLSNLRASFGHGRLASLSADVEKLSLRPGERTPGFGTISGRLLGDGDAIVFMPRARERFDLDFPHVFSDPLPVELRSGTFGAWRGADGWRIEGVDLDFTVAGASARARASVWFDPEGTKPSLDTTVAVVSGEVPKARMFWPINVMPEKTREWLDRALVAGRVDGGLAIVRGDLDDWPFKQDTGRFEAHANIAALTLDYHPRWPAAHDVNGHAVFIKNGLTFDVEAGEALGNRIASAHAEIPDFKHAELALQAEVQGTGASITDFIHRSTLEEKIGSYMTGLSVGGTADVSFDLDLPIAKEPEIADKPTTVRGTVRLHDADLRHAPWNLAFDKANGPLRFSQAGFSADELAVLADGDPASLSIAQGEFVAAPAHSLEASLRGELPVSTLVRDYPMLAPFTGLMPGRSAWTVELAIDKVEGDVVAPKHLVLRSDLVGTAIDLPAPLRKDADSAMPARIALDLPVADSPMRVELGRLLRADLHLPGEKPFAAAIGFGLAEPGPLPESGLRVRGDVAALDLGAWSAIGGADGGGGGVDIDLDAGVLDMFSREFPDTHVSLAPEAGGTRIRAKGPLIDGTVLMPGDRATSGVTAEFEKLHFPEARPGAESKPFDPGQMPPLHLWVKDLRFGKAQLGDARVETFPASGGMRVERLETRTPNLEIRARGDWSLAPAGETSRFDATFTAEDLGKMLDTLGFAGMFEGGQTVATLRGQWPGSPAQFGLSTTDGTLEVSVGKGRIPDVEPGMGRVFGLISFQALPRRLSLDFSDFFGEGLAFDRITGKFKLENGNAYTDDVVLKGPSVEIKVTGRTGLAQRDYDQQLEVSPKVGGVLPVVGALAAGPAGAAAGLVVQNVLSSPLKQIGRARYTVKGSWDQPQIDLVEKQHSARHRAKAPPPSGE